MNEHNPETGEIIESVPLPALIDSQALGALARAEIDTQVATARAYPRSIQKAINNILTLATLDEETAIECIYAVPRGSKTIRGPSIRLAETIASQWGNQRNGSLVVTIDRTNKIISSEGFFHDLETNSAVKASVQRSISTSTGRLYGNDMIQQTGNAANSIARRNAILAGVPRAIWRRAYFAAEEVIRGDIKTLGERREKAFQFLAQWGLTADQIFKLLSVKGMGDIDLDMLVTLRGYSSSLKNGETTVEELLRPLNTAPSHTVMANPLKDVEPASGEQKPAGGDAQPRGHTAEEAQADKIVDAAGNTVKDRTAGDAPADKEQISEARKRGREARAAGHQRKAMPPEYRDPARKTEADEWRKGYDETPAPAVTDKTAEG